MSMTRRELLGTAAGGAAIVWASIHSDGAERAALAGEKPTAPTTAAPPPHTPGSHVVVPLPFAPGKLRGISEKMIVSHHDNNYAGAVKNLNKVEQDLATVGKDAPGFVVSGLRQSQLTFNNSMVLHEAYFANLGGDGKLGGPIDAQLAATFGSAAKWEEQFRQLGASLGGGSGWAVLHYDFHDGGLGIYWSGNHTQVPAFGAPLLVLDMYEHAYQMDYGAAAAKYIDAFFQNVAWDEVNRRLERAIAARSAMHK